MERPKLPEGLVWRKRPDGSYFDDIYFKKQYRNRRIRGSSGTRDPREAARRLRLKLQEVDNAELYGKRPDWTFNQAVEKMIREFRGSEKTLRLYAQQADLLSAAIGRDPLRLICKDRLRPFIEARFKEGVSPRTVNLALEVVRRVLRLAAYYWRDESGLSWIENCPIIPFEKGARKKPYALSWSEQERFFDLLPGRMRRMAIFDVNTGLRERTLINLRWAWEKHSESLGETVFEVPAQYMKNGKPMTLVLNRLARQVVESMRGFDAEFVFGKIHQMTNNSWNKAWKEAGLPTAKDYLKGVHNLRHTFGKRLRDAGVDERDVQDLLHHVPKNVTRHYSEPELCNLKASLERIVPKPQLVSGTKTPQISPAADTPNCEAATSI